MGDFAAELDQHPQNQLQERRFEAIPAATSAPPAPSKAPLIPGYRPFRI